MHHSYRHFLVNFLDFSGEGIIIQFRLTYESISGVAANRSILLIHANETVEHGCRTLSLSHIDQNN